MLRPPLPSLARAQSLARSSRGVRVCVATGEPRPALDGRPRWRLQLRLGQTLDAAPSLARMRVAVVEPDASIRAMRMRPLTLEQREGAVIITIEARDVLPADASAQLFLVALDPAGADDALLDELGDSAIDAPGNALAGLNYLVRDFNEFRGLLLDRISTFDPGWSDRNVADLGVMLTEVLAYLADDLAYYQDAVATEAYLTTARRRKSVHRHVRLLDYWLDDGAGARVWVRFAAAASVRIPAGTALLAAVGGPALVQAGTYEDTQLRKRSDLVFETMDELVVEPGLARIRIVDRSGRQGYVIPAGATEIEVEDVALGLLDVVESDARAARDGRTLSSLEPGYVLLFESRSDLELPAHPVRIIGRKVTSSGATPTVVLRWDHRDAPKQPLPVSRVIDGILERELTVMAGNVTLADFGESQLWQLPANVDPALSYRPSLPVAIVPLALRDLATTTPAAVAIDPPAAVVRPAIRLSELRDARALRGEATLERAIRIEDPSGFDVVATWTPVPDLLLSAGFSRTFVVESEAIGSTLRFGDGTFGRPPAIGAAFLARARVGDPSRSDVGVGAISTVVAPRPAAGEQPLFDGWALARLTVDNPVAAVGGRAPELIATAKRAAPALANCINAALTLADYRALATRIAGVADVATVQRWTGSWMTTFVHVRASDSQREASVLENVERVLATGRVAGRAFIVRPPDWVALAIRLQVTLAEGFGHEGVRAALHRAFFRAPVGAWEPGFFHPSRWRFGETVWASAITTWAEGVAGVASVSISELARLRDRGSTRHAASTKPLMAASTKPTMAVPSKLTMAAAELPLVAESLGRGYLRLDIVGDPDADDLDRELAW